jgi:gliding motility-associated-like protein
MTAYIQKYKLAFTFMFLLAAGVLRGQQPLQIDSMRYLVYDPQYIFNCGKATPIDLFKAASLYVSPNYGYWGDVDGVPYNGKAGERDIKERQYTNGNIFTPPTSVADTGIYRFYFYFTSPKEYCGIRTGSRFIMDLYLGTRGCLETVTGEFDNTHYFCYGSSVDMNIFGKTYSPPVTIADLLLTNSTDPDEWKENGVWVTMSIYSDRERKNLIGNGDKLVNLYDENGYDSTYYVVVHRLTRDGPQHFFDSINITLYPKSRLEVFYSPDITNLSSISEYGMDDQITITVDTSNFSFQYYRYLLNNNNLNKYILGGDTTKNEITLNALAFTGVEDFVTIIATDKNNCLVRSDTNVLVHVPFPNVFTPDGDGVNDVFLGGDKFRNREFHLEIFNRWGNRLYYGESGWDGNYNGNKVPPGTYEYVLILKQPDGSTKTIKNTVTLIRESR